MFVASAYINKGMYSEAVPEAQKASDLSRGNSHAIALLGYALSKSGKQVEARAALSGLLKRSTERYVPQYNIAEIYNGLGEHDDSLAWLEREFAQRDPLMVFLKVDQRFDNLRSDPHFQDLLRRVGFTP